MQKVATPSDGTLLLVHSASVHQFHLQSQGVDDPVDGIEAKISALADSPI